MFYEFDSKILNLNSISYITKYIHKDDFELWFYYGEISITRSFENEAELEKAYNLIRSKLNKS